MSDPIAGPPIGGDEQSTQEVFDRFLVASPASPIQGSTSTGTSILESRIGRGPFQVARAVINPYLRHKPPAGEKGIATIGAQPQPLQGVVNCITVSPGERFTNLQEAPIIGGKTQQSRNVVNPYLRRQSSHSYGAVLSSTKHKEQQFHHRESAMGLHSRHRVGAVKASKRYGAGKKKVAIKRANNRKNQLGGLEPADNEHGFTFNPNHHCVVCRAVYFGCTKPHRPHHERCHRNKVTRGVAPGTAKLVHMAEAKTMKDSNPSSTTRKSASAGTTAWQKLEAVWCRARMASLPSNNQPSSTSTATSDKQIDVTKAILPKSVVMEESLGCHLRCVLEARMASINNPGTEDHEMLTRLVNQGNKSLPAPILLLFDYINDNTRISHRSKSGKGNSGDGTHVSLGLAETLAQRHKYYDPNTSIFTFPKDPSSNPFQHYHSIEGMSIFSLDWEAMFPGIQLPQCMEVSCGGTLVHDRSNFSKGKKLFPVFTAGGTVMWGSVMIYKCLKCSSTFSGNDGCFLAQLDDHVAAAYPVEPWYALANYQFHLSMDLTEDLRSTMLSNGSGDSFSAKLHHFQGKRFSQLVKTYASKAKLSRLSGGAPCNWTICFSEWNGKFAPSGSQLRSYYLDGEKSCLTSYQYSNNDRYKRELQQVGKGVLVTSAAVDWTFQVLKTSNR